MPIFKRSLALLLLICYLPALGGAGDLLKLPLLIGHYNEHRETRDTEFVSFLVMHYVIESGTDADQAEDRQLPFKSAEGIFVAQQPVIAFNTIQIPEKKAYFISYHFSLYKAPGCYNYYLARIWQPPRSC